MFFGLLDTRPILFHDFFLHYLLGLDLCLCLFELNCEKLQLCVKMICPCISCYFRLCVAEQRNRIFRFEIRDAKLIFITISPHFVFKLNPLLFEFTNFGLILLFFDFEFLLFFSQIVGQTSIFVFEGIHLLLDFLQFLFINRRIFLAICKFGVQFYDFRIFLQ